MNLSKEKIIDLVKAAGVIGAGGGGFPTHVKLNNKVDTIIANGSECEPLLMSDKTFIREYAELLIEGLKIATYCTSAKEAVIAVKPNSDIEALKSAIKNTSIRIHVLCDFYPIGDENLLTYEVTKKIVKEGDIPISCGVLVNNVATLGQVAEAIEGKAVTERLVTITGEVLKPQVVKIPIGTTYNDAIKIAGGSIRDNFTVLDGGPFMGSIVDNLEEGIGKTTSAILVLPNDSRIVVAKRRTTNNLIRLSKSACSQCEKCTNLCPRYLLGHEIYPHMTMRTIDYNLSEPSKYVTSVFLCSQCGLCELIACDIMNLSPKRVFFEYKKRLLELGIKNSHLNNVKKTRTFFEERRISIELIKKRLNLSVYPSSLPYTGFHEINRVKIPLFRHFGSSSEPVVEVGKRVKRGELIAVSKLGINYHSPINGQIIEVSKTNIGIGAN